MNGWTNYETWVYCVWLENDKKNYDYLMTLINEAKDEGNPAAFLADSLKEYLADNMPELNGVYCDLLNSAISSINYDEIARSALEEYGQE